MVLTFLFPAFWDATRAFMLLAVLSCFAGVVLGLSAFTNGTKNRRVRTGGIALVLSGKPSDQIRKYKFQFSFIYTQQSQQQATKGALYCKDPTTIERNPNNQLTPFEQAIGNRGNEKLPFNRTKPPAKSGGGHLSRPVGAAWCQPSVLDFIFGTLPIMEINPETIQVLNAN